MNSLTPIQCDVLQYIGKRVAQVRLPPTHREISAAFKWRSNAAAKCHLLALEKKGFIRTMTRISRGIEIKPAGWDWIRDHEDASMPGEMILDRAGRQT